MLALGSLVMSYNFNRFVTHSHVTYITVIFPFILASLFSLAFVLYRSNAYLKIESSFSEYLAFFGWVALACIPWSFCFAFESSMTITMTALQILLVSTAFLIQFNPKTSRLTHVIAAWSVVFTIAGVSFTEQVRNMAQHPATEVTAVPTGNPAIATGVGVPVIVSKPLTRGIARAVENKF